MAGPKRKATGLWGSWSFEAAPMSVAKLWLAQRMTCGNSASMTTLGSRIILDGLNEMNKEIRRDSNSSGDEERMPRISRTFSRSLEGNNLCPTSRVEPRRTRPKALFADLAKPTHYPGRRTHCSAKRPFLSRPKPTNPRGEPMPELSEKRPYLLSTLRYHTQYNDQFSHFSNNIHISRSPTHLISPPLGRPAFVHYASPAHLHHNPSPPPNLAPTLEGQHRR